MTRSAPSGRLAPRPLAAALLAGVVLAAAQAGCGRHADAPPLVGVARGALSALPDAFLVKDLVTDPRPGSNTSWGYASDGTTGWFKGCAPATGCELWRTDGTPAGTSLSIDLAPGPRASDATPLFAQAGTLYFAADDGTHGVEPWVSDGTVGGTRLLVDADGSGIWSPSWALGRVFFVAQGTGLYATDGTPEGTVLVQPALGSARISTVVELGGVGYFSVGDVGLYRTDGTPGGTSLVAAFGAWSADPVVLGTKVVVPGYPLFASDGTAAGTGPLGTPGSASYASQLTAVGSRVVFTAMTSGSRRELFATDGTTVTQLTSGGGNPEGLVPIAGGLVAFVASTPTAGREPWVTDGVTAWMVKDLYPGTGSGVVNYLAGGGGRAWFYGNSGTVRGLYVTDGTPAGTLCASIVAPHQLLGPLGSRFVYTGQDGATTRGVEPYLHDPAGAGTTVLLADTVPASSPGLEARGFGAEVGGRLVFPSNAGLMTTDGTAQGTTPLPGTVNAGAWTVGTLPDAVVYPGVLSGVSGLVSTDAMTTVLLGQLTLGATTIRTSLGPYQVNSARLGDILYFSGQDLLAANEVELWRTDGTPGGTARVVDLNPGSGSSNPSDLVAAGQRLFFSANVSAALAGVHGLWSTDGTGPGTARVTDATGRTFGVVGPAIARAGDVAVFLAGGEWWRSDGTPAGTRTFAAGAGTTQLAVGAGRYAFFESVNGVAGGTALWRTDGTAAGTILLARISPAPGAIQQLVAMNDLVFLVANDGVHGYELWRSDGTPEGTGLVRDVLAGPSSGVIGWLTPLPSRGFVAFSAYDEVSGAEPWLSDGTAAGTLRAADVVPGPGSSRPMNFAAAGPNLYFGADDGVHGYELWAVPIAGLADEAPPSISCPAGVAVDQVDASGADATFAATVVDNLTPADGIALSYLPPSGSRFAIGQTTVVATATDAAGNAASCSFPVRVRDTHPPEIACPSVMIVEATAPGGAPAVYPAPVATDAESVATVTSAPESGWTFPLGTTTVTAIAVDGGGNVASCAFDVVVRDTLAPALSCSDVVAAAASSEGAAVALAPPAASDAVSGSVAVTLAPASGALFPVGATPVTATARDAAGNVATCTFTVTVSDTAGPQVTCPGDQVAEAAGPGGAAVEFPEAVAVDAVSDTTVTYAPARGALFPLGDTPVTATGRDGAGNEGTCSFAVRVQDTTPPSITCPADVAVTTGGDAAPASLGEATATDAVSGVIAAQPSVPSGSSFPVGTTTVEFRATDGAGNTAICTLRVDVTREPQRGGGGGCSTGGSPAAALSLVLLLLATAPGRGRSRRR